MTHTLQLWVEGTTDAALRQTAEECEQGGALPPLVRRTLAELYGGTSEVFDRLLSTVVSVEWLKDRVKKAIALPRGGQYTRFSPWAKKMLMALAQERNKSPAAIIVAIRDCDGDRVRLRQQTEVNVELANQGLLGQAVGTCIEELEAWLLADLKAFQLCFGRGPESGVTGDPESLPEPKEALRQLLNSLLDRNDARSWTTIYHTIAEQVDLETLAKACPKGYGKLRDDLKQLVMPILR